MTGPTFSASIYPPVGGRTSLFGEAWATLQDPWVAELAVSGHKPEFLKFPVQHYEPPPFLPSNAEEEEVLRQAEISMLEKHIIEPALVPGFVSHFVPIP